MSRHRLAMSGAARWTFKQWATFLPRRPGSSFRGAAKADKGHGVLLLTLNYAGDQLAGKQAMKLAKKAGMNVRQVVTGEDQVRPHRRDNQRGLAGAVALYHRGGGS